MICANLIALILAFPKATAAQTKALQKYFAAVKDLEVDVKLVALGPAGEHTRVRFTRCDRFRDPGGELVSAETPVEMDVERTADGLRFVRLR